MRSKALSPYTERGYLGTARRWTVWLDEQGLDIEPDGVRAHHIDVFIGDINEATPPATRSRASRPGTGPRLGPSPRQTASPTPT
ncbi:hypothetical protein GCM10012275_60280 [Longimycelium tulufanense]|uniref:Uncharacterized protein n=1 Tax=Longimycelium tulufanense TaxID=907463 RepID=A0A8J3FZL6_9PSEU|nr:hypothetical protein GCM10012275_60280 [Longimycelium tulufanense]